ncbi:MAG: ATP phosphoribosyltransferase regulatory subunit [Actinobacteria bacterium]|nr:ATP phosphoribosyltransferase regulatory subunit [Actinomycetota bacterium]
MFKEKEENLIVKLPFGFRDIFPAEALEREVIKETIRQEFLLWGYGEVRTPVLEFTKNISSGVGKNWKDKLISFFDIDGNLVSLRADMTIPIARLTGMRIKPEQLPARFFYFANSFRQSGLSKGKPRVVSQAGLELIGSLGFVSDIEVLSILINILKKLGIDNFKIGLGHIKIVEGLCDWLKLDLKTGELVRNNLISNNFVEIGELVSKKGSKKSDLFMELLKPEKDIEKIYDLISKVDEKKVTESFSYLKKVYDALKELELNDYMLLDLSIIRDFEYYSGLLFEVYCPRTIDLLGSGGRYDGLIKKFGLDVPATGFALDVDLLHESIGQSKLYSSRSKERTIVYGNPEDCLKLLQFASEIKSKGVTVELLFGCEKNLEKIAASRKCGYIYSLEPGTNNFKLFEFKSKIKE